MIFNNSVNPIRYIIYEIGEYKPFLTVYDMDGSTLTFQGEFEHLNPGKNKIFIILPTDNLLKPKDYRTISLEYLIEGKMPDEKLEHYKNRRRVDYKETVGDCNEIDKPHKNSKGPDINNVTMLDGGFDSKSKLIVNLHPTASTHIFIKSCDNFRIKVQCGVRSSGKMDYGHYLDIHPSNTFIAIRHRSSKGGSIVVILEHFIPKPTLGILSVKISDNESLDLFGWNNIGIVVGLIVVSFIPIITIINPLNLKNSSWLSAIVALLIFGVSTLFIIKGWLFSKDININILKYYNFIYQSLILIIFAELIGILYVANII